MLIDEVIQGVVGNTLGVAEGAINRALASDPGAEAKLAKLDGKLIAVTLLGPGQTIYCSPIGSRLQLSPQPLTDNQAPDVHLIGRPTDFLRLATSSGSAQQAELLSGGVNIEGDAMLAQRFAAVAQDLDLDWQAPLDRWFGPAVSGRIGQLARGLFGWSRTKAEDLSRDTVNYLRDETGDLVPADDIDHWMDGVDQLRDGVERLDARLKRIERKLSA